MTLLHSEDEDALAGKHGEYDIVLANPGFIRINIGFAMGSSVPLLRSHPPSPESFSNPPPFLRHQSQRRNPIAAPPKWAEEATELNPDRSM